MFCHTPHHCHVDMRQARNAYIYAFIFNHLSIQLLKYVLCSVAAYNVRMVHVLPLPHVLSTELQSCLLCAMLCQFV